MSQNKHVLPSKAQHKTIHVLNETRNAFLYVYNLLTEKCIKMCLNEYVSFYSPKTRDI